MVRSARRLGRASAGGAAAGAFLWFAPWASALEPLRLRWLPDLAGHAHRPTVALTFDDGPDPASTPAILGALEGLGWPATFFLLGEMVRRSPSLAADIAAAGHEVAVHGDRHRSHLFRTPRDIGDDLQRSLSSIIDATSTSPRWFRPPYGSISAGTLLATRGTGLRTVLWGAKGRDWRRDASPASVHEDVRRRLAPGSTVLLHDSDCTSAPGSWRSTLGALPLLAADLSERGIEPVTLSKHLG